MKYNSFTDMPIWNEAMDLSVEIFDISSTLPKSEDYGLTSQIRRSAGSVHANIAEGFGRNTSPDKCRFYVMAKGSCNETQSHLIYGNRVSYFKEEPMKTLFDKYQELIHSLNKLIKSLNS